jgi:hypothetical protein
VYGKEKKKRKREKEEKERRNGKKDMNRDESSEK